MIKAVLFDFFGVLYPDTFWGLADKFVPDRSDDKQQQLHDLIKQVDLGLVDRAEFWERAAELFSIEYDELLRAKEELGGIDKNLLKLCEELKNRGVKTAILSNMGIGFLDNAIDKNERKKHFDEVIISGETGFIKPDERMYKMACEKLNLEPKDCLFFDDINRNVEGAKNTGMNAELYQGYKKCREDVDKFLADMNN